MPLPTTFSGTSARGEGLFSVQKIGANYWIGYITTYSSQIMSMDVDASGNIYALVNGGLPQTTGNLIKIDPTGTVLWQYQIVNLVGSAGTNARTVKVGALGNIYVLSSEVSGGYGNIIYKFNSSGNLIWTYNAYYVYNSGYSSYGRMALDSSENIYVAVEDATGSGSGCWIMKISTSGATPHRPSTGYTAGYFSSTFTDARGFVTGLSVNSNNNVYWSGRYETGRSGSPRSGYTYSYTSFIHSLDSTFTLKNGDQKADNNLYYYNGVADSNNVLWSVTTGVTGAGNYGIIAATPSGTQFSVKIWSTGYQTNQPLYSGLIAVDASNKLYFCGVGEVLPSSGLTSQSGNLSRFNYSSGSLTYDWNNYFDASTTLGGVPNVAPVVNSTNNLLYVVGSSTGAASTSAPFIAVLPADGTHTNWTKTFSSIGVTVSYSSNPSPTNPTPTTVGTNTATTISKDSDNVTALSTYTATSSFGFSNQTV